MNEQVVVRCKDLRKTYEGKVEAVRGLDLTIYAGQCFGLLGPNGAGKTTTIEILEGLLDATARRSGDPRPHLEDESRELREMIGISLQETRLGEKLTVRETVELFAGFYKQSRPVEAGAGGAFADREGRCTRRQALRRTEAAAGNCDRPGVEPEDPVSRRADDRARPAKPPAGVGHRAPVPASRVGRCC